MIEALVIVALALYAVRYAFSGADNALYYNDAVPLPDIHDAEQAQQLAATGGYLCLLLAVWILAGWTAADLLGLCVSLAGAIIIGDYHFNRFITRATGSDTSSWYWPLFKLDVPKWFSGRRWLQPLVGGGFFLGGMVLWAQ